MTRRGRPRTAAPWVVCVLTLCLSAAAVLVRARFSELFAGHGEGWAPSALAAAGSAGTPVVGAVLVSRSPARSYGWLWCGLGLMLGSADLGFVLLRTGAPLLPIGLLAYAVFPIAVGLLALVLLFFPTGRLPGPRWRWLLRALVLLVVVAELALPWGELDGDRIIDSGLPDPAARWLGAVAQGCVAGLFLCCVASAAAVVARFRTAGPVERQQLKWFVAAATGVAGLIGADLSGLDDLLLAGPAAAVWTVASAATFTLVPIAMGVAVLRYRLYEIDRIVSRTVSYALLTGGLLALYVLTVTALRPVLTPLTGSSELAVAASTLAVAALFRPARRRVQIAVDRRFDRAGYDAARTVEAYARRLSTEVDLHEVTAGLRDTVTATVGPERVGLWLREPARRA